MQVFHLNLVSCLYFPFRPYSTLSFFALFILNEHIHHYLSVSLYIALLVLIIH